MRVTASAPGKLNLLFRVGDERDDGFHEVFSVYQAINIREHLTVQQAMELEILVTGSIARQQIDLVPTDRSNLVVKAAEQLAQTFPSQGRAGHRLCFEIEKGIPVLGGMAGGSADAAAALVAVSQLWDINLTEPELLSLGAELGSDVPFSILGGTALGQGRGEKLTKLDSAAYHWVLVFSAGGLSTPKVFQKLDELRAQQSGSGSASRINIAPPELSEIRDSLASGDPNRLARWLENDLEAPAIELLPQLGKTLELARSLGALHAQVSGSGPTVFLLAENEAHASWLVSELTVRQQVAVATTGNAAGAQLG